MNAAFKLSPLDLPHGPVAHPAIANDNPLYIGLVTQQRGTRAQWLQMIRWMQDKQNLWEFQPEVEDKILTYLEENYPPREDQRRASIPPHLMPPNPYAPPTQEPEDAG